MIKTNEVIIKIISKLDSYYGNVIDMTKTRELLDEVFYDYDIVDKEKALIVIDNDLNEKAFLFVAAKKIDGLSEITLKNYSIHLRHFNRYMNKNIKDITTMDIRIYLVQYAKTGVKKSTILTRQDVLRSYFSWLLDEGYIGKNPMKLIKPIKVESRVRKPLGRESIEKLINGSTTLRQKSIVLLLFSSGIRLSELISLDKSDIMWESNSFFVIGKGNKERKVYFDTRTKIALQQYLNSREDNNEALFVSYRKPHDRLGQRSVQREIKLIAENAKIDRSVFPHIFRHNYATTLLNRGVDITVVKELLGHNSVSTTEIYSKISSQEIERQYRKMSL